MIFPNLKIGFSGRFKLTARNKKTGRDRVVADWFPNIITNNGLDNMAEYNWGALLSTVAVGDGSSTPSVSDNQLDSIIASTSGASSSTSINSSGRYLSFVQEWQYSEGEAAGNISEVGVGTSSADLFSRALVVDSFGNPTTITVLSNELLTVTYELRCNQPTSDIALTVDGRSLVLRSAGVDSTFYWGPRAFSLTTSGPQDDNYTSSQSITSITTTPSFNSSNRASVSTDPYVNGSYTRTGSLFWNTSESNFSIPTVVFRFGCGQFQFSIDPPINKTNTDELTIGVRVTWGRQGELPS